MENWSILRINIFQYDKNLLTLNYQPKNKKPVNIEFTGFFVESPGIEPGSKQATKELSTRLFPD